MNSESITPLAEADFARVLDASRAVLDAQLETMKAQRELRAIIGELTAPRSEDRADETALAELQRRWPALAAEHRMHLVDCCEEGTEPVPFEAWVLQRVAASDEPERASGKDGPPLRSLVITGRALHAGAPAIADADFQATGK